MGDIQYICGVHFCDYCGDCMHCYGEDQCYPDGEHYCSINEDDDEKCGMQ